MMQLTVREVEDRNLIMVEGVVSCVTHGLLNLVLIEGWTRLLHKHGTDPCANLLIWPQAPEHPGRSKQNVLR